MSFDKISEVLDIANEADLNLQQASTEIQIQTVNDDVDTDYELSRRTYHSLIEQGQQALTNLQQVAAESDSPFAYQMISALMKSIADTTEKLLKLQKAKQELNKDKPSGGDLVPQDGSNYNQTNNVFVGSTEELLKYLNKRDNKEDV